MGGTGSWSKPYKEHPEIYDVKLITLPEQDVRNYIPPDNVYGILASPPCTNFAVSGARWWKDKDKSLLQEALDIVYSCLNIIKISKPKFWCLENPVGRLKHYIGNPIMYFQPCDYGDPYTKKTCLWGIFNKPIENKIYPYEGSKMHTNYGGKSEKTKMLRSITPSGFAKAFFEANK